MPAGTLRSLQFRKLIALPDFRAAVAVTFPVALKQNSSRVLIPPPETEAAFTAPSTRTGGDAAGDPAVEAQYALGSLDGAAFAATGLLDSGLGVARLYSFVVKRRLVAGVAMVQV